MKYYTFFFTFFFLFSCSTTEQETTSALDQAEIKNDTIHSSAKNVQLGGTEAFLDFMKADFSIEERPQSLLGVGQENASSSESYILQAKSSHSSKKTRNKDRFQEIELSTIRFESQVTYDSVRTKLLTCFSADCVDISNKEGGRVRTRPGMYIFNHQSITIMTTECQDVNDMWMTILFNTSVQFAQTEAYILLTECGRFTKLDKATLEEGFEPYILK